MIIHHILDQLDYYAQKTLQVYFGVDYDKCFELGRSSDFHDIEFSLTYDGTMLQVEKVYRDWLNDDTIPEHKYVSYLYNLPNSICEGDVDDSHYLTFYISKLHFLQVPFEFHEQLANTKKREEYK